MLQVLQQAYTRKTFDKQQSHNANIFPSVNLSLKITSLKPEFTVIDEICYISERVIFSGSVCVCS